MADTELIRIEISNEYNVCVLTKPIPELKPTQVLVKTRYSLISPGTELAIYQGTHTGLKDKENHWASFPFSPGYAAVGEVVQVGEDCQSLTEGDLIYYEGNHASHQVLNDSDFTVKLDENHPLEKVVWARFAQIAYTSLAVNPEKPPEVLIFGAGMIGNLAAQLSREICKNRAFITDIVESRLSIAEKCGIMVSRSSDNDKKWPCIIDATGLPSMISPELNLLEKEGTLILLGSTRGNLADFDLYNLIHRKCSRILGAHESFISPKQKSIKRNKRLIIEKLISLIAEDRIIIAPLVTHSITCNEIKDAYEGLINEKEKYMGVLIRWE